MLIKHFGGVTEFWQEFLPALETWFDRETVSVELRTIYGCYSISAAMTEQAGMTSMAKVVDQYENWFAPIKRQFSTQLKNVVLIPSAHVPRRACIWF